MRLWVLMVAVGAAAGAVGPLERRQLREEARDMFYHAYRAYMENAYPADELMPLSCRGRVRGREPPRGDIDDCLGNFSLTLVDTLDTLAVMGDVSEFEHAVRLVVRDVSFDRDLVVSVFETNIRVLGGLLSAHVLAELLREQEAGMEWYRGELLAMAKEVGTRLLPAFNTSTGIPHARVNLRHGLKNLQNSKETCTACAGTMILEMAALSRLSGEGAFEAAAHRAMDALWHMRHRSSDLMGTVLNVHSGDWVRRDSGVGAGIDSYYEYCLKAYVLLGEERYLRRFDAHYAAVMKYVSQGPLLLDVLMHRPHTNSRNFMDALLAFWPGLQVLKGDLRPAVETHEMLYQVAQRHNLLPEAFTTDFQVHWAQHLLRPEFIESTYFLHRATGDPYYLQVGRDALRALQKFARVPCGYAAVKDVRTAAHEDRMDSFVLAETFKYLFLLFAEPQDLPLDLDDFLFTTEAHLLPLRLAKSANASAHAQEEGVFTRMCPNTQSLLPESVRRPLKNMVSGVCPRRPPARRRLHAAHFQVGNPAHVAAAREMGVAVVTLPDGRLQLLHTAAQARSPADAEEGLLFMHEMLELSKAQAEAAPLAVSYRGANHAQPVRLAAGPAHFGRVLRGAQRVVARLALVEPLRACAPLHNAKHLDGRIAVIERGDCMFVDKARRVEAAGAVGAVVLDNTGGTSSATSALFAMSGDGRDDVRIPVLFLFQQDALQLLQAAALDPDLEVTLSEQLEAGAASDHEHRLLDHILERLKGSVHDFLAKHHDDAKVDSFREEYAKLFQQLVTAEQEDEEEQIRTSGRRGVGGAQDGDGLGSSVGAGERLEVAEGRPPRFTEAVETWPPPPRKDKDEL